MGIEFSLRSWGAWAPGLRTEGDFASWARGERAWGDGGAADVSFLPPPLRRRLTPLARSALHAVNACLHRGKRLPAELPTVFASRYGESRLTVRLLREILSGDPVSPMRFAMSVHNSVAGLFAIGCSDRAPSVALAGGRETFFHALLEADAVLRRAPPGPVLVVAYEEPLDAVYHGFADETQCAYALALLVERTDAGEILRGTPGTARPGEEGAGDEPAALAFLRWLLNRDAEWTWGDAERPWRWSRLAAPVAP